MTGNSDKKDDNANALLGDLESIRSLLDENAEADETDATSESADSTSPDRVDANDSADIRADAMDDDVPVLDDVIEGALKLRESELGGDSQRTLPDSAPLTPPAGSTSSADASGLSDDLMRALLDDDWRARAETLLAGARQDIENNREDWQPEYTDELTDALKARIDATVHDWIGRTLARHVDELRGELVNALSEELGKQVSARLGGSSVSDVS